MTWAVVPAAGRGSRFGGDMPKQYLSIAGRPMIEHSLRALLGHPDVDGVMVALAPDDPWWGGWRYLENKPIYTCIGGAERADSVLAALQALPATVSDEQWILVHDAARPCLRGVDLTRLLAIGQADPIGAILAAPVRDTLKRAEEGADQRIARTEPREGLWRALTPQLFRRGGLIRALQSAMRGGLPVTDEAMAMEAIGLKPRLVEGSDDNIKVTTAADVALAESILKRMA
jgi:2-C-methyl-D-erythritol 4-phosphate cytidylyltransferase